MKSGRADASEWLGRLEHADVPRSLFVSPKTVEWNLSKIYRKLGVRSRPDSPPGASAESRSRRPEPA